MTTGAVVRQPVCHVAVTCDHCKTILLKRTVDPFSGDLTNEIRDWDGDPDPLIGACRKCGTGMGVALSKVVGALHHIDVDRLPDSVKMRTTCGETLLKHRDIQRMFDGFEYEDRLGRGESFVKDMAAGERQRKRGGDYPIVSGGGFKADFSRRKVAREAPFNCEPYYEIPMAVIRNILRRAGTASNGNRR